jgi:steroid delta-isomerase-like uncharacterized protein
MSDANKTIARRVIDEIFNQGRIEVIDEIISADFVGHDAALPEPTSGPEGLRQTVAAYRGGFPDINIAIDDQVAEGDRVVTRWTARGTHDGDLWGIAPTAKQATVTGITIDRIEGGKIVESWTNWDTIGLLQQIGVVPSLATT